MNFRKTFQVKPGERLRLAHEHPGATHGFEKSAAVLSTQKNIERLFKLQHRLYAENKRSLLILLQGMDAAGKDGVIRNVITGLNPQGCTVTPFKAPSAEELDHDFLWRIHKAVPAKGDVGVFNRSHYEDVVIVRVKKWISKDECRRRYKQINHFERTLVDNGTTVLKFFLNISKDEQRQRLIERLQDPDKNWKFNENDIAERKNWEAYMDAYEKTLAECSTGWAPWYVIPSDKKWFRNLAISEIVRETLESMNLKFPKTPLNAKRLLHDLR